MREIIKPGVYKMRNRKKAHVEFLMPYGYTGNYPVRGWYAREDGKIYVVNWTLNGQRYKLAKTQWDIPLKLEERQKR